MNYNQFPRRHVKFLKFLNYKFKSRDAHSSHVLGKILFSQPLPPDAYKFIIGA